MRILLCDDNQPFCKALATGLGLAGHDVACAYGARDALAALVGAEFDVVVLDIDMPDLDGWHLAARIRSEPRGARLRLLALTARNSSDDRQRSADAGFDRHIQKPVGLDRLYEAVGA